jgi:alanine transaminase
MSHAPSCCCSESAGAYVIRKLVADAIEKRDGHPCDPDDLFMTDGASPAVHYMMDLLIRDGQDDALMVPIPQASTSLQCNEHLYDS